MIGHNVLTMEKNLQEEKTMEEKLKRIIEIIQEYADPEMGEISGDSQLRTDLGIDSLSFFSIIDELEQEYGVTVEDSQLEKLRSVKDMVELIS